MLLGRARRNRTAQESVARLAHGRLSRLLESADIVAPGLEHAVHFNPRQLRVEAVRRIQRSDDEVGLVAVLKRSAYAKRRRRRRRVGVNKALCSNKTARSLQSACSAPCTADMKVGVTATSLTRHRVSSGLRFSPSRKTGPTRFNREASDSGTRRQGEVT